MLPQNSQVNATTLLYCISVVILLQNKLYGFFKIGIISTNIK